MIKRLKPVHPGQILLNEFMKPLGISQNRLGRALSVPVPRVNAIVNCKRSISADTALRLARYFDTTPHFWMNLQMTYDLEVRKDQLEGLLEQEVKVLKK